MVGVFAELDRRLRAEGLEPRVPAGEVAAQDEGTCVRLACRNCRRRGLVYRPYADREFKGNASGRYRPLAVCPRCGEAIEF
jgi:hypothetical protein